MLELGKNFKFVYFMGVFFGFLKNFFLDNLYIKVFCLNIGILTIKA